MGKEGVSLQAVDEEDGGLAWTGRGCGTAEAPQVGTVRPRRKGALRTRGADICADVHRQESCRSFRCRKCTWDISTSKDAARACCLSMLVARCMAQDACH